MLIIPKAVLETLSPGIATFTFQKRVYDAELKMILDKYQPVHLTISRPKKAKKTGEGSRLNLVHLWFREIAQQLTMEEETVKGAMKRMSVSEGWPTCLNPIDGREEPISIAWASEDHMAILAKVTELFAALNGIDLSQEE